MLVIMVSNIGGPSDVRMAEGEDCDRLVEVLVDSHVDYAWERWALPWDDRRLRLTRLYSTMLGALALPFGEVWMTSCARAVAVWLPTSAYEDADDKAMSAIDEVTADVFGARLGIVREVDAVIAEQRPEAEWHLATMGTSPVAQGQGLGSEVLRPRLSALGAADATAVLETSDPRNLAFYRHAGFEVTAELADLPHGAPVTWVMERAADSGTSSG